MPLATTAPRSTRQRDSWLLRDAIGCIASCSCVPRKAAEAARGEAWLEQQDVECRAGTIIGMHSGIERQYASDRRH